jgi:hypothetical protein
VNADRAPVGKTRDGGWQIGVSATVDQPVKEIWDFLTSTEGTACGWATGSRSYVATARMRRSFYGMAWAMLATRGMSGCRRSSAPA